MDVIGLLTHLRDVHCVLWSTTQACTLVTNTQLRQWITGGAVEINGYRVTDIKEVLDYPVFTVVVHPVSKKRRNTLRNLHGCHKL